MKEKLLMNFFVKHHDFCMLLHGFLTLLYVLATIGCGFFVFVL